MIERVKMINWRAYDLFEVGFNPGITFIIGANGVGKTSILEAIAFALTGEVSTVKQRTKLLRDPARLAMVHLTLSVNGRTYQVRRSQSLTRAESATLILLSDGEELESSHKRVTERIERLMGVSADFLQRIVYMAEGDVFRFLENPPGQALDVQIRRVLGLHQLDQFFHALEMADRKLKEDISPLQDLLKDCDRLGVRGVADFDGHGREMDQKRHCLYTSLRTAAEHIVSYRHHYENVQRLKGLLDKALEALRWDPATQRAEQMEPVAALVEKHEAKVIETQAAVQRYREESARLRGERMMYQSILEALKSGEAFPQAVSCPTCGHPLCAGERQSVMQNVEKELDRITRAGSDIDRRSAEGEQQLDEVRQQYEALRELCSTLACMRLRSENQRICIADLIQETRVEPTLVQANLEGEIAPIEQQGDQLEAERAGYLAIRGRLRSLGYATPEQASEALIGLEVRSLSLRAAYRAAQDTLGAQRNVNMGEICHQVASLWEAFRGDPDPMIQLDNAGIPTLQNGKGHRLDLSQFSGGEKTAMLIMLHTIIAHHVSKSDFLLIDEPLEHLDPINRRSLIGFLIDAYRQRGFQQAIVATYEESLLRKYMSQEGVNVIYL